MFYLNSCSLTTKFSSSISIIFLWLIFFSFKKKQNLKKIIVNSLNNFVMEIFFNCVGFGALKIKWILITNMCKHGGWQSLWWNLKALLLLLFV